MTSPGVVIVGAGQSAAVAARTLREQGYRGCITMLGRERHRPYERPPLSKAVLTAVEEPRLDVLTEDAWVRNDIELLSNSEAVAVDLQRRHVRLADGRVIGYERCLIATGGEAQTLPFVPTAHPRVHHIRTLDDARRLRASLQVRPQVAILGGGFLGLEVAHSALSAGASVTVLERAASLLVRFLPCEASAWLEARMRDAGAKLLLGASLSDVHASPSGRMRLIAGAGDLEVDELIVAVGLSPNDSLAREAGLEVAAGGGILVDASCRTSNEHVFACGDCTSQQRPGQTAPTRLESWQNANEQARTAAASMLGAPLPAPAVPWFWTDQGQHNIQVLGLPAPDLEYVRRGDLASDKVMWIGHRGSVPLHGVVINAGSDLRAIRPLFERGQPVQWEDFPLHTTNLRAWVKQLQAHASTTA
ncbi:NAD(P)/FAD-dependent oxidoreductase [Variovorax sp. RA8]|uniref:NAD(P)/FAD-dependent oxidoreductase n=1 Tax=Variovorax sp. (strain JCM 16519 / RA8) TaxID=662548 RepID=UPI001315B5F5|nr:FAD-dependent oxidoreductase [Variovorax sp. RA8]VTU30667.1 3-phenylpropionate/cinnamic acid dioxygenase ferredoxin--NAD(+) reductase component [Variovorax sp. RA8]